ncbi:MAG: methyltransferase domain-containing protein, partial [Chitinophagia bacterium]|nr:methyltransferase domain-containing protein [Chitinophagia bacterium]
MKLVLREKCPVCENQTANVIYSIPYGSADLQTYLWSFYGEQGYPNPEELLGAEFTLHECENCQLVYQSRIPDSDSLTELYTRWISYDKVSEKFLKNRGQDKFDRNFLMLRALIDHFGTRHFRIFDYGFGYAELLKQAVALGIEAYGLEFNEEQVKMAQDAGIKVVDFSNDVDVPKMDVIFCEQVLEHVTEPRQLMAHLAKISKPGTILHLSVPNSIHVQRVIRSIDWKRIKGGDLSV